MPGPTPPAPPRRAPGSRRARLAAAIGVVGLGLGGAAAAGCSQGSPTTQAGAPTTTGLAGFLGDAVVEPTTVVGTGAAGSATSTTAAGPAGSAPATTAPGPTSTTKGAPSTSPPTTAAADAEFCGNLVRLVRSATEAQNLGGDRLANYARDHAGELDALEQTAPADVKPDVERFVRYLRSTFDPTLAPPSDVAKSINSMIDWMGKRCPNVP